MSGRSFVPSRFGAFLTILLVTVGGGDSTALRLALRLTKRETAQDGSYAAAGESGLPLLWMLVATMLEKGGDGDLQLDKFTTSPLLRRPWG